MALSVISTTQIGRASGANSAASASIAVQAGDLIVVPCAIFNTGGTSPTATVSDGTNGTYSVGPATENSGDGFIECHYFENSAAASITVTVDPSGSSADIDAWVVVVRGAKTSGAYKGALSGTNTSTSSTMTRSTGTLDQADNIVFAIGTHDNTDIGLTADGTHTPIGENENNGSGQAYLAEYIIVSSTTSVTSTIAIGDSRSWWIAQAVFEAAAGGGGGGGGDASWLPVTHVVRGQTAGVVPSGMTPGMSVN